MVPKAMVKKFLHVSVASLAFVGLFHCASQTRLAPEVRAGVQSRHEGAIVALKSSCYFGDLYDENELWLLSPYPFAETYHIVDTKGAPIHPANQQGIIPAGTRFKITKVEFPDVRAMAKRMLTTPRYNPWVYLEPAEGEPVSLGDRKSFIVVLPMDLETEAAVEEALAKRFEAPESLVAWLGERSPSIQVAIKHKDVVRGMDEAEVSAAWGEPLLWFGEGEQRVGWYRGKEVWFIGGKVSEIKDARTVEKPPAETVDSEASIAGGGEDMQAEARARGL